MTFRDEQADILGGPILQRPENGPFSIFHQHSFVFITLVLALLAWYGARLWKRYRRNRDFGHKKAMRRQHGIPDTDNRPFAVAYATAVRARAEREAQERMKVTYRASDHRPAVNQRSAPQDLRGLGRRVPEPAVHEPRGFDNHASDSRYRRPELGSLDFPDRYDPHPSRREAVSLQEPIVTTKPAARRRRNLHLADSSTEENRKRTFVEESDVEPGALKKSRIDGEELIDGDEDADWYAQASRTAFESQGTIDHVHTNGRHGRNDSGDDIHEPTDDPMEDVEVDEVSELESIPRGKKRDRAEAGSTFGGDDEDDVQNKVTHHRKRRTVSRRKSEVPSRGMKRNREAESLESEGEGNGSEDSRGRTQRGSRKKRDKKTVSGVATSDRPMDDRRISKDPLCGGRRIRDTWEEDGVQYKVGDNGERLRLTLVKKARSRYPMPKDSQHPDRSTALEIYVEMWMTEGQYKKAEQCRELVWQELPRTPTESETPDIPGSPTKSGKDLLWDSVKGGPAARRPFRQSLTPNSPRINPFQQSQSQPILSRRIASSSTFASPLPSGPPDSPVKSSFRTFSKWEKQDREAEAMAKIRAKMQEQKKTEKIPEKIPEMPTSATAPELGAKTLTVPTITFTPAPSVSSDGKKDQKPATADSKPALPFSLTQPASITSSTKTSTTSSAPGFSVPATSARPAASVTSATTPTATSSAAPSFSFARPPLASTSTAAPSAPSFSFVKPLPPPAPRTSTSSSAPSSIPNFFAKPSTSTSTSTSPFVFGATSQPQSSSAASTAPSLSAAPAPKQAAFSFSQPSAPSPSSSTTVPSVEKPSISIFGASDVGASTAASGSAPAGTPSVAPAPATGKVDLIMSNTSATTAPAESSKPTAPTFPFGTGPSAKPTSSTAPLSAPSVPKFSFGQPSISSTFAPTAPLSAPMPKPKASFPFEPAPAPSTDVTSSFPAGDDAKKATTPLSVFGSTTVKDGATKDGTSPSTPTSVFGSTTITKTDTSKPAQASELAPTSVSVTKDETAKPLSSAFSPAASAFGGGSTFGSSSIFGKLNTPTTTGGVSSSLSPPKPAATSSNTSNLFSTTPAGSPASGFGTGSTSVFSLGSNTASSSKPLEGSQPATSAFGSTSFGSSGSTPTFSFGQQDDASSTAAPSKAPTTFSFDAPSKKDDASSTAAASRPPSTFLFGAPSSSATPVFGQPTAVSSGTGSSTVDGTQPTPSIFGKPSTAAPTTFNFSGASSGTFNFRTGSSQNQKQEQ